MKSLRQYITESFDDFLRLSAETKKTLLDLDLEYGKIRLIARYETSCRQINNAEELFTEFRERHIENNENYFPILEYDKLKWEEYDLENRTKRLIEKFQQNINIPLAHYYIVNLEHILDQIDYLKNLDSDDYEIDPMKKYIFDDDLLKEAFDIIHNSEPYKMPEDEIYQRDKTGKDIIPQIQQALDDQRYDWKIIINNNMPPRMGVNPEKTFRIRETAKFSDVDIENLIAHEIKGHVQKRYNAYQTGLFLFVFGLSGKNVFDEGMAIWNTLNLTTHQKPFAIFSIALSYIYSYYLSKYDFCTAFDKLKDLLNGKNVSDRRIFMSLIRSKRSTIRTDRLGYWSGDIDYFRGYKLVDAMTTEEREKIIRWNVGPNHFYQIDRFEKFIKYNNFKPISNNRLEEIKSAYHGLKD